MELALNRVKSKVLAVEEQTYSWSFPGISRTFAFTYHAGFLPMLLLVGRLLFGFFFIWSGFAKVVHHGAWMGFGWFKGSAESPGELYIFLNYSTGPFKGLWADVANSAVAMDVIAPLVVIGQILIGFGILFGILTRLSFFSAALMMLAFYSVNLWPLYNPFLNEYLFYIGIFAVLGALGAGRVFGLDAVIERAEFIKKRPWLGWILA